MNSSVSLSEQFRCSFPETVIVSDEFLSWKRDMKTIWFCGASFSVLGCGLLAASAVIFPAWRNCEQNKVWMHMCSSGLTFLLIYICRNFSVCYDIITMAVLTYLGQVTFLWVTVAAWWAYTRLVLVFLPTDDSFITRASLVCWLTPVPFALFKLTLDAIEFPDILFGDGAKVLVNINGYSIKLKCLLNLIYYIKDVTMYSPAFLSIMASTLLNILVVHEVLWKRSEASALQDRRGNAIIALLFLTKTGAQFLLVIFARFYTFTRLDYFTAFMISHQLFVSALTFVVAMRSSRELWVGLVRRSLNRRF